MNRKELRKILDLRDNWQDYVIKEKVTIDISGHEDKYTDLWTENSVWSGYILEYGGNDSPVMYGGRTFIKPCDENNVSVEEWESKFAHCEWEPWMEDRRIDMCQNCKSNKVYHDKKEEYVCPFCL